MEVKMTVNATIFTAETLSDMCNYLDSNSYDKLVMSSKTRVSNVDISPAEASKAKVVELFSRFLRESHEEDICAANFNVKLDAYSRNTVIATGKWTIGIRLRDT
jgi:hypothetical protein